MSNPPTINLHLWPKQGDALLSPATEQAYGGAAGGGKALALDTPILTTNGWRTMGELSVGDTVFSEDGSPTRIVATTEYLQNRPCYEVVFSNGASLTADESHLWKTLDEREREKAYKLTPEYRAKRRSTRASRSKGKRLDIIERNKKKEWRYLAPSGGTIRTTKELSETLRIKGRVNHSIRLGSALQFEPKDNLLIPPYLLGLWLGDGNSNGGGFTTADKEMIDFIQAEGYEVTKRGAVYAYGILGLQTQLKSLNLINNKHIPDAYLKGSFEQRLALIQGLMDTDGCCNVNGKAEFCVTNRQLAEGVSELFLTMGIRASMRRGKAYLKGRECADRYRFCFTTSLPVFRLPRKRIRQKPRCTVRSERIFIEEIRRVDSVPVRCIQVEHPSGMFLAGKTLIPTHNSHLGRVEAIHWSAIIPGLQTYLFRREHNELVKNHMEGVTSLPALLNPWVQAKKARIVKDEIRFWNGSKIFLCHCQHEKDVFKWLGPEMYFLIIEQAEQFTEFMLRMLFGRNRMPDTINIPEQYRGLFPRVKYTFNPGGVGHAFFKREFYDVWKKLRTEEDPYPVWIGPNGRKRQFIQALLQDNPSVNPTEYAQTLSALPARMRDALLKGDMEQVMGAYFPDLQRDTHLVKPFRIPEWWPRYVSMDWGACGEGDPYSVGYWTVSDGTLSPRFPRGYLLCYRVIRGHGLPKTTVHAVAERMKGAERGEQIVDRVAGGDIKNDTGFGITLLEEFSKHGIHFRRADMRRVHGWAQIQERVVGVNDKPMIGWFEDGSGCEAAFESIRNLQHDVMGDANDTAPGDDHDADMTRYECMARAMPTDKPHPAMTLEEKFREPTIDDMWKRFEAERNQ
jgi:hypothetical protein